MERMILGIKVEALNTDSNFDIDGNEIDLEEGESFSLIDVELSFSYGWSKQFEVGAAVNLRRVSDSASGTDGVILDNSITGIHSFTPYLKYKLLQNRKYALSLRAEYGLKLFSNEEFRESDFGTRTILGDDGDIVKLGVVGGYFFNNSASPYSLISNLFFRNPAPNLSEEILFDIALKWRKKKTGVYFGIENVFSLGRDEFSENPEGRPLIIDPTASNLFNSIDRSYMDIVVGGDYRINKTFAVGLGARQRISGESTDSFTAFNVSLKYFGDSGLIEKKARGQFKSYSSESLITKVSSKNKYIVIDKGLTQGIKKGSNFDIYESNFRGTQTLIARGRVIITKAYKAVIKINQRFTDKKVEVGMVARGR